MKDISTIESIREELWITQQTFADIMWITRQTYIASVQGRRELKSNELLKVVEYLEIPIKLFYRKKKIHSKDIINAKIIMAVKQVLSLVKLLNKLWYDEIIDDINALKYVLPTPTPQDDR